jgi:peptidoglycan hydrolase-like protein with peptidoglycan-binding domain
MASFLESIEDELEELDTATNAGMPIDDARIQAYVPDDEPVLGSLPQMYRIAYGMQRPGPGGTVFGVDYDANKAVVAEVQTALNAAGYRSPDGKPLVVDGVTGPGSKTAAGVRWLEAKAGLAKDAGIIGAGVLGALKIPLPGNSSFGTDSNYDGDSPTVQMVQTKFNLAGYQPALKVDGIFGDNTQRAILAYQAANGLAQSGTIDAVLLQSLGIPAPAPSVAVKISTVAAALTQAAQEKGYAISPTLVSLMIGQLRGAEGAYPGVKSSLGGTNNMGASNMTQSLVSAKTGQVGWGAFAHPDSSPGKPPDLRFFWIAPSPLEAARHWFQDNWWGPRLAQANVQTPEDYATVVYQGGYFEGNHVGERPSGQRSLPLQPNEQLNVQEYANNMRRGIASAQELSVPPDDPSIMTVNPSQFASVAARGLTEAMFNSAKGGQWSYLLPADWATFLANNGVVWFGPPPSNVPGGIPGRLAYMAKRTGDLITTHPYVTLGVVGGLLAVLGIIATANMKPGAARPAPRALPAPRVLV